jgi:thioredoxin 1
MGIPTLMFFKDGKIVDKIVGAQSKKNFKDKIDALLKS